MDNVWLTCCETMGTYNSLGYVYRNAGKWWRKRFDNTGADEIAVCQWCGERLPVAETGEVPS